MVAIHVILSDLASSTDGEDGEHENTEETDQGKLSEDDEPGWVMGTITKTIQQLMAMLWQKLMTVDKLTQSRWEDATDYFCECHMKYGTTELRVPVAIQLLKDHDPVAPAPTTFGGLKKFLDILPD